MAQLASNTSSSLGNCDRFECVLLCIIVFNVPLLREREYNEPGPETDFHDESEFRIFAKIR